jgi:hypothetical protein
VSQLRELHTHTHEHTRTHTNTQTQTLQLKRRRNGIFIQDFVQNQKKSQRARACGKQMVAVSDKLGKARFGSIRHRTHCAGN